MTIQEAYDLINAYERKQHPTAEDDFLFTEAMQFLIQERHSPEDMVYLGGWYYEQRNFDLALKYYEMAATYDYDEADVCLGYIWYYGRTGERDYEKAFHYYEASMQRGNLVSTYKVADMYRNGYYVDKDYDKYVSIIEHLYDKVQHARNVFDPVPEVYTRLAHIRSEQGNIEEAIRLYRVARNYLEQRIYYNAFFGNRSIMKWLIQDLYQLTPFDPENMDLYDLFYVLQRPAAVTFEYEGETQHVESVLEDNACVIHYNDKWYRNVDDFMGDASIGGEHLTHIYNDLYNFRLLQIDNTYIPTYVNKE